MVGVELPIIRTVTKSSRPNRWKPFLKPLVRCAELGSVFSQSMQGELVGGITVPDVDDGTVRSWIALFLEDMSAELCR